MKLPNLQKLRLQQQNAKYVTVLARKCNRQVISGSAVPELYSKDYVAKKERWHISTYLFFTAQSDKTQQQKTRIKTGK